MPYLQAFLPRRRFWRVSSLTRRRVTLLTGGDAEVSGSHNGSHGPNIWDDRGIVVRTFWWYDKIAAIVRGQFARMQADPQFSRFGTGRSIDSRRQAEQMTIIQLCALAGGPCYHGGKDMLTAHRGIGITEAEWMASLDYAWATLQENGILDREQQEFVALFERYRDDIVEGWIMVRTIASKPTTFDR